MLVQNHASNFELKRVPQHFLEEWKNDIWLAHENQD